MTNEDTLTVTLEYDLLRARYVELLESEPLDNPFARRRWREAIERCKVELQRLERILGEPA